MKACHVTVLEAEHEMVGEWPMVYGKARSTVGGGLVYFQVDGLDLRRANKVKVGAHLILDAEEIIGTTLAMQS